MRIFLGIPCYSNPAPEVLEDYMRFAFSLGRRCQEHEFVLGIKSKSEQFRARNSIVESAYSVNADYLLMLDDDMIIDIDSTNFNNDRYGFVTTLLAHMEADPAIGVVGPLYYQRQGECRPVLMAETDGKYRFLRDDEVTHSLQEVDVQGGGCLLVAMKVFDKIGANPFAPEHEHGTDIQLCKQVANAGYKVCSDTSIELGHLTNKRSIVTSRNRHEHFAEVISSADDQNANYLLARIKREFREDVMEYLEISDEEELRLLANEYTQHAQLFSTFDTKDDYYRASGTSYLARACFIHDTPAARHFDDFLLKIVKADCPGVGMDFGCGSAPITFEFCKRGQVLYFYDIEGSTPFEFLKWRADKYSLTGITAFFNREFPPAGSLDYALFLDSIEHLTDWDRVVSEAVTSLKDEGYLITNFVILKDSRNVEHIFMDKPNFMKHCTSEGLWPINSAIFQKRSDISKSVRTQED